jgi:glyoxylate carboligase
MVGLLTADEAEDLAEAFGLIRAVNEQLLSDPAGVEAGLLGLDLEAALDGLGVQPAIIRRPSEVADAVSRAGELLHRRRAVVPVVVAHLLAQMKARVR